MKFIKSYPKKILFVLSATIILLSITGFLGRLWWGFELTSHFRVQYFWLLALSATWFTFGKKWNYAIIAAIFALVNLSLIIPYIPTAKVVQASQYTLRSLSINLDFRNSSYDKATSFISRSKPDILVLEELTDEWEKGLKHTLSTFPHSYRFTYPTPHLSHKLKSLYSFFGPSISFEKFAPKKISIGLFSHLPFENIRASHPNPYPVPHVKAKFKFKGKDFILFGVHLISPVTKKRSEIRNKQLLTLANMVKDLDQPTILIGDFNTSPWSSYFKDFIQMTRLKESRKGAGLHPSWPTPFMPLRIPIDHSLTSNEITVQSFSFGPNIGSDHFPIILDFSIN